MRWLKLQFKSYISLNEPDKLWRKLLKERKIYQNETDSTQLFTPFTYLVTFLFFVKCIFCVFIDSDSKLQAFIWGNLLFDMGIIGLATHLVDAFANFEVSLMRILHHWLEYKKFDPIDDDYSYFSPERASELKRKLMVNYIYTKGLAIYLAHVSSLFYIFQTIYDVSKSESMTESIIWIFWGAVFVYICQIVPYDMGVFWGLLIGQFIFMQECLNQLSDYSFDLINSSNNNNNRKPMKTVHNIKLMYKYCSEKFIRMNRISCFMLFILCHASIPLNTLVILNGIKEKGFWRYPLIAVGGMLVFRVFYTQKTAYYLDGKNKIFYKLFHSILARREQLCVSYEDSWFLINSLDSLSAKPGQFTARTYGGTAIDGIFMINFYFNALTLFLLFISFYEI